MSDDKSTKDVDKESANRLGEPLAESDSNSESVTASEALLGLQLETQIPSVGAANRVSLSPTSSNVEEGGQVGRLVEVSESLEDKENVSSTEDDVDEESVPADGHSRTQKQTREVPQRASCSWEPVEQ